MAAIQYLINAAGEEWRLAEGVTLRVLASYEESCGPLAPVFRALGLDAAQTRQPGRGVASLAVPDLARLTGYAIREMSARDKMLAGHLPLRRCDWRVILYSLSGSRTLREAIERCIECFEAIDWRCGRMTVRSRADSVELELDAMRPSGSTAAGCLIDLFGLTEIHALLAWLIGQPISLRAVWLDQDEAVYSALDLPDLPFALRLGGGWTGFEFDVALLDYPVVRTAAELASRPQRNLLFGGNVQMEAIDPGLVARVRDYACTSLRDGQRLPSFGEVAAFMGRSEATLRRRLMQEGASYRLIRESCRREIALDLLRRTAIPIEDIAIRLDYCDSDAFRQAFRQWVGMSPSAYRSEIRAVA